MLKLVPLKYKQLVPQGTVGELYIGGAGLARGYLGNSSLTAEKFVDSPFELETSEKLYRSGDFVRWQSDGNLEFIGRIDHQIKIRGHRVELREIESVLLQREEVRAATVQLKEDGSQLVAYVDSVNIQDQSAEIEACRSYLAAKLPSYMVPAYIVLLDKLPMTNNGKLDVSNLPEVHDENMQRSDYVAPRNAIEEKLCVIWQELLGIDKISVTDNFFLIGGHSLLAMQLLARIRSEFDLEVELFELIPAETIAKQCQILSTDSGALDFDCLQQLKEGSDEVPIYMVPGLGGQSHIFFELSKNISSEHPVYAFNPVGLDGKTQPHTSAEEAASYFVERLITHQTNGPCILLGYSLGASVAFEMAKILESKNKDVPLLIVLDGQARYEKVVTMLKDKMLPQPHSDTLMQGFERVFNAQTQWNYSPEEKTINKIVVVQSQDAQASLSKQWQAFSECPVETFMVSGGHESILLAPEVSKIGETISDWLCMEKVESE